jgi:hypothetical protein
MMRSLLTNLYTKTFQTNDEHMGNAHFLHSFVAKDIPRKVGRQEKEEWISKQEWAAAAGSLLTVVESTTLRQWYFHCQCSC